MPGGIGFGADIKLRDQVPPAEELPPQRRAGLNLDREVHQAQDPLVGELSAGPILGTQEPHRPVHLVTDHQDLLVETEDRPPCRRKGGVLGHAEGGYHLLQAGNRCPPAPWANPPRHHPC
jgi:hypothetical protein